MKLDCYGVLGLSPTAEDAVVRAAYLALMRTYHPDRNASPEAAARARAITEAYKTIGDPARRAEYDAARRAHLFEFLGYDDEVEPPRRQWPKLPVFKWPQMPAIQWPKLPIFKWPNAPVIQWPRPPVIGAVAASALAVVIAILLLPLIQSGRIDTARDRTTQSSNDNAVATEDPAADPPRSTETMRPPEDVAPDASRLAETSPPSPPPAAMTTPENAPATRSEPGRAIARPGPTKVDVPTQPKRTAEATAPPKPAPADEKHRVATLEWQSTSFYNQSVNHADGAKRLQLQQARDLFVTSRNACRSDKCVGDAHVSYIREIAQIMQKPKQTNP